MASGEDALRGVITELKEKIANITEEMIQLRKRQKAYIARLKLMENHLNQHHPKGGIEECTEQADSSDESFSTTELLEVSLSSISSSIFDSSASCYDSDSDQNDSDSNVENGRHSRFHYKKK